MDVAESERHPYVLYVDEIDSFATTAFANMLANLRGYGLGTVLSTRSGVSVESSVSRSILKNANTLVSFRVSASDAELLSEQFGGELPPAETIFDLSNYQALIKLMIDGARSQPFQATTLPPLDPKIGAENVKSYHHDPKVPEVELTPAETDDLF
jgi:hypothetical protein